LAVALELPEVALGAPLRREAEEDFVMVGDEKREKIKSYGGTGTEGYVGILLGLWFDSPLLATILATGGISIFGDSSL
jgi:hypothetical protein